MSTATANVTPQWRYANNFKVETQPANGLKRPALNIWFPWVAASSVGFALSAIAFRATAMIPESTLPIIAGTVFVVGWALFFTLPGVLHWLILRRQFIGAGWWIPASGLGSFLGYIVLDVGIAGVESGEGFLFISERYVLGVACAVAGAAAGTVQWLVLRRWASYAGWWVLASSIGWIGATWVFGNVTIVADVHFLIGAAASGTISGVITGAVLIGLLRFQIRRAIIRFLKRSSRLRLGMARAEVEVLLGGPARVEVNTPSSWMNQTCSGNR